MLEKSNESRVFEKVEFNRKEHFDIYQQGLRLNDEFTFFPSMGKKRSFKLQRSSYIIQSSSVHEISKVSNSFYIPQILGREYKYKLSLVTLENSKHVGDGARYFLESLCHKPFKLNGNFCLGAFITKGDKVQIAYDQLDFSRVDKDQALVSVSQRYNIPKAIIESDLNILVEGETGVGKSHVAKLIHKDSGRSGSFVHVNVSAYPKNLVESEIFGHVRGSFTGAIHDKVGAIQEANYGTIFIDEVDSLSLDIQTKLLLFLDSKVFRPVGGMKDIKSSTRIIFASGKNLKELVQEKIMRKDFYYRISSGLSFEILPLRKNPQKIDALISDFCMEKKLCVSPSLVNYYKSLPWHGNIRELLSHLERKFIIGGGKKLIFCELDKSLDKDFEGQELEQDGFVSMSELKKSYTRKVHQAFSGNVSKTSKVLNISENTVRKILTCQ
ncbi:sigma 54-interacting transcriptional regulator [bacterium]|nr:sigma 54-interacting transcriptional regulator [bacterium]